MATTRSLSFRLYPSRAQAAIMAAKHAMLKDLWNAALDERIGAWRRGVRVGLSQQEKQLKDVRTGVEGWRGLVHTHEAQIVLKRLDLAFQGFFRRIKAGQVPGFPRFRSAESFRGWGYKEHGNGFRVEQADPRRHGFVTLFGVGRMRMRGVVRTPGRILKADVIRGAFGWSLNVVVETDQDMRPKAEGPAIGLDWGVSEFATLALEDGTFESVPNPRLLNAETEALREKQRGLSALARAHRISRRALRKQRRALARKHAKVAARRKDFLHKVTAKLAARHPVIVTEKLMVRNMTASARGTVDEPGRNVAQKAGLNRSILDTAPAAFLNMLRYKAEEAGSEYLEADTRKVKPSQRCPSCGEIRKKTLSLRTHDCACGCQLGRDEAAAAVLLAWGLEQLGQAPDPTCPRNGHPAGTVGVLAAKASSETPSKLPYRWGRFILADLARRTSNAITNRNAAVSPFAAMAALAILCTTSNPANAQGWVQGHRPADPRLRNQAPPAPVSSAANSQPTPAASPLRRPAFLEPIEAKQASSGPSALDLITQCFDGSISGQISNPACVGYLAGYVGAIRMAAQVSSSFPICLPDSALPNEALVADISEYLEQNQDALAKSARSVTFQVLGQRYPCQAR